MADINSPKEFLQEALSMVDTLNEDRTVLQQNNASRSEAENKLETLKKNIEQEKTKTVNSRREDLEAEYNRKLRIIDNDVAAIEGRRSKARKQGVSERVTAQTAGFKAEIANYKAQLDAFCKEHKLSGLCKSPLYHKLFMPARLGDWILILFIVALMIGSLVGAIYLLSQHKITVYTTIGVAVVDIALALLYAFIAGRTRGKHPNEVRVCRQFIDEIAKCKKGIENVTKNIHNDTDDSPYNLGSFDAELQAKAQEKADLEMQKTQALYQFDAVTKQQLINEIDGTYAQRLTDLTTAAAETKAAAEEMAQKVSMEENQINGTYVQYLGSKNLNHETIERMIALVDTGEAASVTDAVSRLNAK